ncbi:MAG: acylneuraminate cytidylyltransferase, partial [Eubacteriales bacterium]|nr:acylneuraminate cytidylyltransferase [Eubacteriales bacterium]
CAEEPYEKEHVTPYMYYRQNSIGCLSGESDFSNYRLTVDTAEDFMLMREIYTHFFKGKHDFFLKDVMCYLKEHPELTGLNANIEQRKVK